MSTKNATFTLDANETQSSVTSRARVTGTTVYGDPIYADEEITQSAYVPPTVVYLYIENETTYSATTETHIMSQSQTFYYDLQYSGIVDGTLGTASTINHASEHGDIDAAWIGVDDVRVALDGTTLGHIGTGYAINYIDVTGTSVNDGSTVRATLVLRIELTKISVKFNFDTAGAPTGGNPTYALRLDGDIIVNLGGTATITLVSWSQHNLDVRAVITNSQSYDPQTADINVVADGDIIDPNYTSQSIELPGTWGTFFSDGEDIMFKGSGTVVVSFTWSPTYVYSLTTTQAGCTVVMCGITVTTNSVANQTYTMSSVESSMPYSVTKDGYYPESGSIIGPNRSITVTLSEIVDTYENVRTDSASIRIQNRTTQQLDIASITIALYDGDGSQTLGTWMYNNTISVNANGSQMVQLQGYGLGTKQVKTNTAPTVSIHVTQFNGAALWMTFQYPEWRYDAFDSITMSLNGETYDGEEDLPVLERAIGDTYVFPHSEFDITFN